MTAGSSMQAMILTGPLHFSQVSISIEIEPMLAEKMKRWRREVEEEGRKIGFDKGHKQGREEGEATLFKRLLELKFGPISDDIKTKIETADAKTLLLWGERILFAESLDQIFID